MVLCKKICFQKFRKFHRKTPVLDSFFNKVAGKTPTQVFSCENCEIFKNTYFEEKEPEKQNLYCVLPKALLIAIRNLLPGFSYINLKCYMTQCITPEILTK